MLRRSPAEQREMPKAESILREELCSTARVTARMMAVRHEGT
mgnify:CR=1 FL=1